MLAIEIKTLTEIMRYLVHDRKREIRRDGKIEGGKETYRQIHADAERNSKEGRQSSAFFVVKDTDGYRHSYLEEAKKARVPA